METQEILKELRGFASTEPYRLVLAYFENEIESVRKANDNADYEDVLRNQGAILKLKSMHKTLKKPILRGEKWNPQEDPMGLTKDYDGGFGE